MSRRPLPIAFVPVACALLIGSAVQAHATPIVAPVSATTTMSEWFPLVNAINQTGLSATYVSGTTDFATFVAGTTHDSQPGNDFISNGTSGNVTFDLGSLMNVKAIAFWNFGGLGGTIAFAATQFSLAGSVDAGFSSPIALGTFNPAPFTTLNPAQVFTFAPTTAQYFRLEGFSSNGVDFLGIGEVAFDATAVPEPATFFLLGAGLALGAARWRKARSA